MKWLLFESFEVAAFRMRVNGPIALLERQLVGRARLSLVRNRAAAVLLPLIGTEDSLSLVMTRRALAITQGGEVAFPGGRVDERDMDRADTALREATEEISLPRSTVRVLGVLDDIPNYDNTQAVTPVVGYVSCTVDQMIADPREVQSIFAVPLIDLQEESRWSTKTMTWRGMEVQQYYFDVAPYAGEGEELWGLSAFCTIGLLASLAASGAPGYAVSAAFDEKLAALQKFYGRRLKLKPGEEVVNPSDLYSQMDEKIQ